MSMIFPSGTSPENSPLHVICCNDTCSFTWTGAEHINQDIVTDFKEYSESIGIGNVHPVPISLLHGDNVVDPGPNSAWYDGPALLSVLETIEVDSGAAQTQPFAMAIQQVNRSAENIVEVSGYISTGSVRLNDAVRILPSGKTSTTRNSGP